MSAELPSARVVQDRLPRVQAAPRHVPGTLWCGVVVGSVLAQVGFFLFAAMMWIAGFGRLSAGDMWLFLGVTLAICIPVWAIAAWRASRQLQLLRDGAPTFGTLTSVVPGDDERDWSYTFRYEADGATHEVTIRSPGEEPRLQDDVREPMLYVVGAPQRALPLDHLPGHPALDANGQLVARDANVWPILLGPLVAISGVLFVCIRQFL